jgi:hypothetical protein
MSNVWTGLIFGIGFGGWVYAQMMRRTSNTKTSLLVAAAAGLVGWLVITTLLGIVFKDK